jgi:LmbE family N-acetylglucosaminyl deacetylase
MQDQRLRILAIGAHPDDSDFEAGGVAALYARRGHQVKFVSLTNGDAGHYKMGGAELAQRRRAEALKAAATIGIQYEVLDIHDEELMPTLETRRRVIQVIREFQPHLVMTHRPNDYHPDHRYTSTLVQDAAYLVTVAGTLALTEHLRTNPVFVYFSDRFQKPYPFVPDVVVGIDQVVEKKVDMLHCHESQVYEWLPYNELYLEQVPRDKSLRRAWLRQRLEDSLREDADRFREKLIELYGEQRAAAIKYAEAFECCEYGLALTGENIRRLFPFFDS